jgi:hypothetical protein
MVVASDRKVIDFLSAAIVADISWINKGTLILNGPQLLMWACWGSVSAENLSDDPVEKHRVGHFNSLIAAWVEACKRFHRFFKRANEEVCAASVSCRR